MINEHSWKRVSDFQKTMKYTATINDHFLALFMEVAELADSVTWKPWHTTEKKADVENVKREIVDIIFFLIRVADTLGIDAEELTHKFEEVLENNYKRYGGKTVD